MTLSQKAFVGFLLLLGIFIVLRFFIYRGLIWFFEEEATDVVGPYGSLLNKPVTFNGKFVKIAGLVVFISGLVASVYLTYLLILLILSTFA